MNIKKIVIGIIIISSLWIGNLLYFYSYELDEPMFFKHYYELSFYDDLSFRIYYLVSNNDDVELSSVKIPELSDMNIYVENHRHNKYKYYTLKTAYIKFKNADMKKERTKNRVSFTDLTVNFTNGDSKEVNIGQIIINKNKTSLKEDNPFEFDSCGSSNNNKGYRMLSVSEHVIINDIKYDLKDKLDGFLNIYINSNREDLSKLVEYNKKLSNSNDEEIDLHRKANNEMFDIDGVDISNVDFPIELDENDHIKINYQFISEDKDDIRYYNYYEISARIIAEKENGDEFIRDCMMHYTPHLDDSDIKRLVKKRRDK